MNVGSVATDLNVFIVGDSVMEIKTARMEKTKMQTCVKVKMWLIDDNNVHLLKKNIAEFYNEKL